MKHRIFYFGVLFFFCLTVGAQVVNRKYSPKISASVLNKIQDRSTKSGHDRNMNLYLRFSEDTDIDEISENYNIRLNVGYRNLYTAIVPVSAIEKMAEDERIIEIDAGQEVREMMDSVRFYTNIDNVYNGSNGLPRHFRGKDILVGIIDAGMDFLHPNFRDEEGNCRIKAAWDQNYFAGGNSPYGYGIVYNSTEEVVNAKRDFEFAGDTHGTHVAGIAAGSYNSPYRGVAPESDIILVSTNKTEQGIIDAVDFLLNYSDNAAKPIAINLSIGSVLGYKDGTDNFTVLIDELLKDRKGQLLAIAAGNEGDRRSTLYRASKTEPDSMRSVWNLPDYNRDNIFFQGESEGRYRLSVELKDTLSGNSFFSKTFTSDSNISESFENIGSESNENGKLNVSVSANPANQNPVIRMSVTYNKKENEIWIIGIYSENGKFMLNSDYGEFISAGMDDFAEGTNDYTIASTATGFNTIAVGAYVSKNSYSDLSGNAHNMGWETGDLYPLSGKGPTYDGRTKPEITAPGAAVVSSLSSYAGSIFVKPEMKVMQIKDESNNRSYSWGVISGTSMATPAVTGTLALWLEAFPEMTVDEAREIMEITAKHDTYTDMAGTSRFGHGKLDAESGIKYILQTVGLNQQEISNEELKYSYDRSSGLLAFHSDIHISSIDFFDLSGKKICSVKEPSDQLYPKLPANSIYLARITAKDKTFNIKIAM